jgi:hypothetical protein
VKLEDWVERENKIEFLRLTYMYASTVRQDSKRK